MTTRRLGTSIRRRAAPRRAAAGVALAAGLGIAGGLFGGRPGAEASVPTAPPTFTTPTTFDNPYFPFQAGAVKVFRGKSDGERVVFVDLYLAETRDFPLGGGSVTCSTLQETEFEGGELIEISRNWFAQADDGTVYYFGEVVDNYEDGVVVDHDGSWLVGGPVGNDPPETDSVGVPAVFLPGNPEVGDEYMPEDVPDGPQERDTIRRTDRRVRTPAGRFSGCLEVHELDVADGDTETKWYAPGIGVVLGKARDENFALEATTFRQP